MSFYVLAQSGNLVRRGERGINEKFSVDTSAGRLLRRELINPCRGKGGGGEGEERGEGRKLRLIVKKYDNVVPITAINRSSVNYAEC